MQTTESANTFKYEVAFSRNIVHLVKEQQRKLRSFTIAIFDMGSVGVAHLILFVRHNFEKFKIADLDEFELKNFNSQYLLGRLLFGGHNPIQKLKIKLVKYLATD